MKNLLSEPALNVSTPQKAPGENLLLPASRRKAVKLDGRREGLFAAGDMCVGRHGAGNVPLRHAPRRQWGEPGWDCGAGQRAAALRVSPAAHPAAAGAYHAEPRKAVPSLSMCSLADGPEFWS